MQRRMISITDLIMGAHMTAYVLFSSVLFMYTIARGVTYDFPAPVLPMYLIWTAAFILHGWGYFAGKLREARLASGTQSAADERKAYRDGFNDAVRILRENDAVPGRLMIDDDGELIEEPVQGKRKYR